MNENRTAKTTHAPIKISLNFDTIISAKKSIKRINKKYMSGELPDAMYRNLIYMLSQIISLLRLEKDIEIEKRLDDLEKKIDKQLNDK